ncbi:hypothetical protein DXT88_22145 [Herbaspirillum lusitanum]|uniref:hypothetical protein n=1 Tax=Herbaspirillum lusitanum TaxID=213312 RepID=UPI002237E8BD|nr:hypothetical protein [Herbaspirillum lusitanum]MCW5300877.1 hypothetical protein [Herbaspirillum lusitanum]
MDKTKHPTPKRTLTGRWIDVFRAGTNTDSKGQVSTFTQADLDQIVANHSLGAAPAVLGHPKDNDPAFAWTEEIKRDGDLLYVKFKDINPAFEAGVETGAYRNRSVSIYRDPAHGLRLRHVGWLGAAPPAIDGLSVNFSDNGEYMEFSAASLNSAAWALNNAASLFRNLREQVIADKGVEEADRVIPNYQIDALESAAGDLLDEVTEADNPTFTTGETAMTITKEDLEAARLEGRTQATTEFTKQLEDANTRAARVEADRRSERITTQIEGWKKEGKVLPAEAAGLAEFMGVLETGTTQSFEFSASGQTAKKTPGEWFAEFMAGQSPKVALNEKTGNENAGDPNESAQAIAGRIQEYINDKAKAGVTVSYAEAMAQLAK